MNEKIEVIDSIDRKILALMKEDCRISRQKIAENLDISRQTIQNRIKSLEEREIILKYTLITNEKKLGKIVTALIFLLLNQAKQAWSYTAENLLSRQKELEITEMHRISGDWDFVLKIKTRNLDSLEYNIHKIVNISGIVRTRTLICLSSYESGYHMKDIKTEFHETELLWNFI